MQALGQNKILQTTAMFIKRMENNGVFIQENLIRELNSMSSVPVFQHS